MKIGFLSIIKSFHNYYIYGKRVRVLAKMLAEHIPNYSSVLDIGCGSGVVASCLLKNSPTLSVQGIDILEDTKCLIKYNHFDGKNIPFERDSVDVCIFVDVLHHTSNIKELLKEAARVSKKYILIKDHICESKYDFRVLKFMDWIGNRPHGIVLKYNYTSRKKWKEYFSYSGLKLIYWNENVPIYNFPINLIFSRNIHCIALLEKNDTTTNI